MAKLAASLKGFRWNREKETYREYSERVDGEKGLFVELQQQSDKANFVGKLLYFPYADGKAVYLVLGAQPLTLAHIPIGDAWQIPDAHIRGLRRQDVLDMIERDKELAELFSPCSEVSSDGH